MSHLLQQKCNGKASNGNDIHSFAQLADTISSDKKPDRFEFNGGSPKGLVGTCKFDVLDSQLYIPVAPSEVEMPVVSAGVEVTPVDVKPDVDMVAMEVVPTVAPTLAVEKISESTEHNSPTPAAPAVNPALHIVAMKRQLLSSMLNASEKKGLISISRRAPVAQAQMRFP